MTQKEVIAELKIASKCYNIALEYDYMAWPDEDGYEEGLGDEYSGTRPDEIALAIIRLIDKL